MTFTVSQTHSDSALRCFMSLTAQGQARACLASGNPKSRRATSNTKVKRRKGGRRGKSDNERVRGSAAQIRSETIDLSAEAESFY